MRNLRERAHGARSFTALFGTASVLTVASALNAQAQNQQSAAAQEQVPEQVLITGSLIRGTVAVGAPVTSLGTQDFAEAGVVSVGDLLTQTLPEFENHASSSGANAGFGNFINRLNIHNLNGVDTRTLMLIDGLKMPPQGTGAIQYDPSIIPGIALDRVDVLADGASATYGSLAVAGVVNLILKRGFDGAIFQGVIGEAEGGNFNWDVQGQYGRKWDSGDVTVTVEHGISEQLKGAARSFYTQNFTPWGLDNETPLVSAYPGIVSSPGSIGGVTFTTGAPQTSAKANTTIAALCANCYSIPKGQNGVGLTWAQIQANSGAGNIINNDLNQSIIPADQWMSDVLTLDQDITPWLQFNASGYYSNRRDQTHNPDVGVTVAIPTTNPYYPVGAPPGLQVSYDFKQIPNYERASEVSDRYTFGFTVQLPSQWEGRLNYGSGDEEVRRYDVSNLRLINTNNVSAALGWTIPASPATPGFPGVPTWTKPANLPYLNLFCDPTAFSCISQDLLSYIQMPNENNSGYILHEYNAQFDGPLFDLPAGTLRGAVGGDYQTEDYWINTITTGISSQIPQSSPDALSRNVWAGFGQVNIPVLGGGLTFPFAEKLEIEASYRYDRYNDFGGTGNPRVSADWTIGWGLTARYSWGTNFVAPSFKALSSVLSRNFTPFNTGTVGASVIAACPTGATTPAAGSLAALLNPACTGSSSAFSVGNSNFPAGIQISSSGGVGGLAGVLRPADYQIQPETSRNLAMGLEFAPTEGPVGFLRGLDLQATYWSVKITDPLVGLAPTAGNGLNDPNTTFLFIPRGDPRFQTALSFAFNNPLAGPNLAAVSQSSIQWIEDGADRNEGFRNVNGIDFNASYVWDLDPFGAWNTGITGTYFLHDYTQLVSGEPVVDALNTPSAQGAVTYYQSREERMRYRARLGWADGPYSATLFMDYSSHFYNTDTLPAASVIAPFPNLVANPQLLNLVPSQYLFDISLGYNTGNTPANPYLRNINVFFTVDNIFDRDPPFAYGGAANAFAYYAGGTGTVGGGASPLKRFWRLGITKQF